MTQQQQPFPKVDEEEKKESPFATARAKMRMESPLQPGLFAAPSAAAASSSSSLSREASADSSSSSLMMFDLMSQFRQTFASNNHESMLDFFSNDAGSSEWEEGVAVIESILMPQSSSHQSLSPSQVQGLRKVQQLLLMGGSSGANAKEAHIPKELLQGRHEPGSTSEFILSQFAGLKRINYVNAKQRILGVINAQRFIHRLTLKASSSRRLKVADREAYILPEWTRLTPEEQVELHDMLSWDQLQQWDFDVFALERLTHGQPLLFVGWAVLASPYAQLVMDQTTKAYRHATANPTTGTTSSDDNVVDDSENNNDNNTDDSHNTDDKDHEKQDDSNINTTQSNDDNNTNEDHDEQVDIKIKTSKSNDDDNDNKDDNHHHHKDDEGTPSKDPESPSTKNSTADPTETIPSLDAYKGYGFPDTFKIPQEYLVNFLRQVEQHYVADNPYHNNIHAADVVQSLHAILQGMNAKVLASCELELFSLLLAAVVHDIGHPGKNNSYQVHSHSDLAIQYNDISVLENMHASLAFRLLLGTQQQPDMNIFWGMSDEQVASVRKMVIESVLDTDMTHHFSSVNKIKGIRLAYKNKKTEGHIKYKDEEAWQILHFILHLADISNPAKPLPIAIKWTDRCLEEFFRQGDEEKRRGLPVSPLCDRMTTHRAESQIGFIKFVVQPAFEVLGKIVPEANDQILPVLEANLQYWKEEKHAADISDVLEIEE